MRKFYRILAATTLSASLIGPISFAQDHHDDHHDNYVRHDEWKKGYHMKEEDWHRAQPVDYRHYHLSAPPAATSGDRWMVTKSLLPSLPASLPLPSWPRPLTRSRDEHLDGICPTHLPS